MYVRCDSGLGHPSFSLTCAYSFPSPGQPTNPEFTGIRVQVTLGHEPFAHGKPPAGLRPTVLRFCAPWLERERSVEPCPVSVENTSVTTQCLAGNERGTLRACPAGSGTGTAMRPWTTLAAATTRCGAVLASPGRRARSGFRESRARRYIRCGINVIHRWRSAEARHGTGRTGK
jgi:hypothetical protein